MALQIRTCPLTRLTVGASSDFHIRVYGALEQATPAALHVETQAAAYKPAVDRLASVVNRQRAYISTATLEERDKNRDNGAGVFFNVTDAYLTSLVEEKREAAKLLAPQLASYRGLRKHEYAKQSAELRGMLNVLSKPENAAAITSLGLDADLEALREAAEDFEEAFEAKAVEANAHADTEDLDSKKLAREADDVYGQIVQIVNAYAIVQPSDEITSFINAVNGWVKVYSDIVDGSASGEEPEKPGERPETPSEETPENPDGEGGEQTTPTEPGDDTEGPVPGEDTDGDGSPEVV